MAKFTYKFESILKLKVQLEDNQKNELGKSVKRYEKEKSYLGHINNEMSYCVERINKELANTITVNEMLIHNNYIEYLKTAANRQKEVVKEALQNVDIQREKLIEIVKERKTLEKLKERKYEEYLKEADIEEQKVIDEIISFKQSEGQVI